MKSINFRITPTEFKVFYILWTIVSLWIITLQSFALRASITKIKNDHIRLAFSLVADPEIAFFILMTLVASLLIGCLLLFYASLMKPDLNVAALLKGILLAVLILFIGVIAFLILESKTRKIIAEFVIFFPLHIVIYLNHWRYIIFLKNKPN